MREPKTTFHQLNPDRTIHIANCPICKEDFRVFPGRATSRIVLFYNENFDVFQADMCNSCADTVRVFILDMIKDFKQLKEGKEPVRQDNQVPK